MTTFTLARSISNDKSTAGAILDPTGAKLCVTVEDAFHAVKIPGKTRIPAEKYPLIRKPVGASRFDAAYGRIFAGIHRGMIQLQGVPFFDGVLIHCGNTDLDTEGCVLVGGEINIGPEGYQITAGTSQPTYRRVYPILCAAIDAGDTWLNVVDELNKEPRK